MVRMVCGRAPMKTSLLVLDVLSQEIGQLTRRCEAGTS
jgi:hypothetical protein